MNQKVKITERQLRKIIKEEIAADLDVDKVAEDAAVQLTGFTTIRDAIAQLVGGPSYSSAEEARVQALLEQDVSAAIKKVFKTYKRSPRRKGELSRGRMNRH